MFEPWVSRLHIYNITSTPSCSVNIFNAAFHLDLLNYCCQVYIPKVAYFSVLEKPQIGLVVEVGDLMRGFTRLLEHKYGLHVGAFKRDISCMAWIRLKEGEHNSWSEPHTGSNVLLG